MGKDTHWIAKGVKQDKEYFRAQVEKGVKKLAGPRTKGRVRHCFHCRIWSRTDKFIKEVEEI